MGVSHAVRSNVGDGAIGGGDLRLPPPEHSCTVNCDQYHYGPVSGSGEASRIMCAQAVAGTGHLGLGRDDDGGSGSGTAIWGGGYGWDSDGYVRNM